MKREILDVVFENERFMAGFTTRFGGVGEAAYEGLNLGDHVGDRAWSVAKNREILANRLGICVQNLKFMRQIHSDVVFALSNLNEPVPECDAIVSNLRGAALCVLVADCSPVLLIDERRGVAAAAHAGRAGVMKRICTKAVHEMARGYGCKMSDIRAFVGPNIKSGCYKIGELDVGEFALYKADGRFDMDAALRDEFAALGVRDARFSEICAHCDERYFSYRRDGVTGRFCGFVLIK